MAAARAGLRRIKPVCNNNEAGKMESLAGSGVERKRMKITHASTVLATVAIAIWMTACCSTAPKPTTTIKGDLEFTKEVSATVTADQKIILDGKKFEVAAVPAQLVKMKTSKYITILIYPECKMTRETMIELIKTLVQNEYCVFVDPKSKYADVPVPRS